MNATILTSWICVVFLLFSLPVLGEEYDVTLNDAVWRDGASEQKRPLRLKVRRDGERWRTLVIGQARRYNWGDHYGALTAAKSDGAAIKLIVKMRIVADPWSATAGFGQYTIELEPAAREAGNAGRYAGKWSGTFNGQQAHGAATAARVDAAVKAAASESSPRLLFAKSELPALREKAQTEWGRKMLTKLSAKDRSRLSMAVGRGLLFQLTGEREHAAAAQSLIEQAVREGELFWTTNTYHDSGVNAVVAAIAYDLIFEACDEPFRDRMARLLRVLPEYYYRGADHPLFNPNDGSNWSAMFRSGTGMAALALVGRSGDLPVRPRVAEILRLGEPGRFEVGDGVPVVELEAGRVWSDWLFAGPVKVIPGRDGLAGIGGELAARPAEGTRVEQPVDAWLAGENEAAVTFAPLPEQGVISPERAKKIGRPDWAGGVDVTAAMKATGGRRGPGTCYLYSVVENRTPGHYRIAMLTDKTISASVVIAGRRFAAGDVVYLEKGRLPVLVCLPVASKHGGFTNVEFYLKFDAVDEGAVKAWLADRQAEYTVDLALWEDAKRRRDLGEWADPHVERWLGVGRQRIANWADRSLGEIGWNHEGQAYTQHSLRVVFPFAHAYRQATGYELTPSGKLNRCLLNYVGRTVISDAGAEPGHAWMPSFAPGGGPLGVDNWARGFGLSLEKDRPYLRWLWDRTTALAAAGKFKDRISLVDHLDPMSAAFMFVNYPLEVEAKNPEAIRRRICVDADRGGYVFRNRWKDGDDIAATVFLNSHFRGGGWSASQAGEFRIVGLGAEWAVRGMGYGNGSSYRRVPNRRAGQNVVLTKEPVGDGSWEATATHFQMDEKSGGGSLTFDMDDVYTSRKPREQGQKRATPTRPGARVGYDWGIRGERAFAAHFFDDSGGALFASADRVTGTAGENLWQLVTPHEHDVVIDGARFTITAANGATLHGSVIAPANAKVDAIDAKYRHEINYHGGHKRADFKRKVIRVHGDDAFFVVMTLQRAGETPPVVKAGGDGKSARVGELNVIWDGERISIGGDRR